MWRQRLMSFTTRICVYSFIWMRSLWKLYFTRLKNWLTLITQGKLIWNSPQTQFKVSSWYLACHSLGLSWNIIPFVCTARNSIFDRVSWNENLSERRPVRTKGILQKLERPSQSLLQNDTIFLLISQLLVGLFVLSQMAKWFSGIALAFMGRFKDLSCPS